MKTIILPKIIIPVVVAEIVVAVVAEGGYACMKSRRQAEAIIGSFYLERSSVLPCFAICNLIVIHRHKGKVNEEMKR